MTFKKIRTAGTSALAFGMAVALVSVSLSAARSFGGMFEGQLQAARQIDQQAQPRSTATSETWRRDPTAFVRLVMGEDLSLRPSAAGTPSVAVPDAVRQQIIGAPVTWTVNRRASPFPTGPRTLPTAAIRQDNQMTSTWVTAELAALGAIVAARR